MHHRIGLATEYWETGDAWGRRIVARGYSVARTDVRAPLPALPVDLWLVILDPRTAPGRVAMWLRPLTARIVLVTPHLQAGQSLAHWVPALCLVCTPAQAASGMDDVLALAQSMTGGLLTLTTPLQAPRC
jgi:hypothetical protein